MPYRRSLQAGLIAVTTVLILGCTPRPPVPELALDAPLPDVAAEFRTVVYDGSRPVVINWRMWRGLDNIVIENLTERTADYWQRDGDSVFHRRLFHDDRRGVEFHPGDLPSSPGPAEWYERASLLSPALLASLRAAGSGWRDGRPYRRYRGEMGGARWSISVAVDAMLPLEIDRRSPQGVARTTLVAAFPLSAAPWQPVTVTDYELIDFADLGDRAVDPLVARVQSKLGLRQAHEREH